MARKSRVPRQAASITGTNTPSLPQYKVAIYGRISSMKTELDASFMDMQLQILNEFIANHPDMELHDTYFDDGFSGTHFRRPHFTRMIDDMIAGKFNCIYQQGNGRYDAIPWRCDPTALLELRSFTICGWH